MIGLQLQRGAEHLHQLGPRAIAECFAAIADRTGEHDIIVDLLAQYRGLTPEMLHATGGDRFPPRLSVVPSSRRGGAA